MNVLSFSELLASAQRDVLKEGLTSHCKRHLLGAPNHQQKSNQESPSPLIVGILHSQTCLKSLASDYDDGKKQPETHLLEARLDSLPLPLLPQTWPLPVIATARHSAEGGLHALSVSKRRTLLEQSLTWASAIDIELRSAKALATTITHAHEASCGVILSFHDFNTVPSLKRLRELSLRAQEAGATIFKVAVMVSSEKELHRLIEFQQSAGNFPTATMGMGCKGKESRLILATMGSVLSYGWLYEPHPMMDASTQWSARELSHALRNINTQKKETLL